MISNLRVGQKLTIFFIDCMLAMTHRKNIIVRAVYDPKEVGTCGEKKTRIGAYSEPRGRKQFYLDIAPDTLVFEGWDIPFRADTDDKSGMISGNACFNLVGDLKVIREWVETKNLNPGFGQHDKAKVLAWPAVRNNVSVEGTLVFPEIDTHHAVTDRIKDKAEVLS